MRVLEVLQPGLSTTVQDLGRLGYRRQGVPICGALDETSFRLANHLLGNHPNAPALEVTLQGPQLRFLWPIAFSLTGADLSPTLNEVPIQQNEVQYAAKGDILSFGKRNAGARSYISVRGGFACKEILGSVATHVRSGWGGIDGKALSAGQVLEAHEPERRPPPVPTRAPFSTDQASVRITPGPEYEEAAGNLLVRSSWKVRSESDRAGLRLSGPVIQADLREMVSSPVGIGTVQLPKNGQPLVLLNDGPSIGGYPRIAAVIRPDLPKLAQLAPHDSLSFQWVSPSEARSLYAKYRSWISKLAPS